MTSDMIDLVIRDNGEGIPPDKLPRIFDPFFSTKTDDGHAGMGLGLSVSRSVVEALGGRIEVDSRPARGSTFTAIFPTSSDASSHETVDADTEPNRENPDR